MEKPYPAGSENTSLKSHCEMLIADRWQNSPTHLKMTPRCNCFSPLQAVRDDISVPERSSYTPSPVRADTRKQSPSSAPLCLSSTLFFSAEMSSDRILCWKCSMRLLATNPLRLKSEKGNACWFEWIKMKLIRNLITDPFANTSYKHEAVLFYPNSPITGTKKWWVVPASLWDIPS